MTTIEPVRFKSAADAKKYNAARRKFFSTKYGKLALEEIEKRLRLQSYSKGFDDGYREGCKNEEAKAKKELSRFSTLIKAAEVQNAAMENLTRTLLALKDMHI